MAAKVLDSWALIAFFEDEPGAETVEEIIHQALLERHALYLSVVNWAEIYYNTMRKVSQETAEERARDIATLPIGIVSVNDDLELTRVAAQFKFKAGHKLSLADAFAAALAKEKKAELVTGDPEFKTVEKEFAIKWLT